MIYPILKYPTKSLLEKSVAIDPDNINHKELAIHIVRMIHTMLNTDGVGIASPQVGKNIRVVVLTKDTSNELYVDDKYVTELVDKINNSTKEEIFSLISNINYLINPVITASAKNTTSITEGCLSVPNTSTKLVKRANSVIVEYIDILGNKKSHIFNNVGSVCIQHEIDHLEGKLFFMNLNMIHRNRLMKGYK